MTQREYRRLNVGSAQVAIIYRALREANGAWVLADQLRRVARCSKIGSRMSDLRGMGVPVKHRKLSDSRMAYRLPKEVDDAN